MGRSRKKKPLLKEVEITDVAAEGKAMTRVEDRVVFVQKAVPGDIVDVQVTKKRKNYYEGHPVFFHKYSDIRQEPFCEHFGTCGGCKWQALPYEHQLKYKEREVINNLQRIRITSYNVCYTKLLRFVPKPSDSDSTALN